MPAKKIVLERREENIMVWTTAEVKERLQAIANERGWSLSLLGHEILKAWLEEKSLAWAEQVGEDEQA
jgi:hypothetical protein